MKPTRGGLRWLILGSVLLTLGSAVPARAHETMTGPAVSSDAPVTAPVNLSVWPHLSTNQLVGPRVRNFLSLGLGIDRPYQVTGLQAALGAAYVECSAHGLQLGLGLAATGAGEVVGIQLGGVGAVSAGPVFGLQVAGGIAISEYFSDVYTGWPGECRRWWRAHRVAGIQLAGVGASGRTTYGLQAAGGAASTRELQGVQAAGLFSFLDEGWGLQVTGVFGLTRTFNGLQLSGLASVARTVSGAQVAGLLNWSDLEHTGLQLAPFNLGKKVRGLQLGLINAAGEVTGVQLGLVNLALNPSGVQLGLINLTRGFPTTADAWATELVPVSAAWRTGRASFYTLVGVGVMALGGPRPTALVGLGTNVALGERAALSPDLVYYQAFRLAPAGTAAQVLQLRLPVRWAIGQGFSLQAGPTLNAGRFVDLEPGYLPYLARMQVGSRMVRLWPGAVAGIGLVLP